jgi:hypothetical protein
MRHHPSLKLQDIRVGRAGVLFRLPHYPCLIQTAHLGLYGGVGTAGLGNYYGKYGYDSLTHARSIATSGGDTKTDFLYIESMP